MKKVFVLLAVALVSSFSSVAVYKYFEEPQQVIIRETVPAQYTSFNDFSKHTKAGNRATDEEMLSGNLQRTFLSSSPTDFISAAEFATPAVVNIRAVSSGTFDFWNTGFSGSSGSGVIISADGFIVTNNHVIEEGNDLEVTLYDDRKFKAKLIGTDQSTDLAVLKIEVDDNLPFLVFGNSDSVRVGEWVLAVGNPFNLESTVTAGIVSAKGRSIDILEGEYKIESFIQTDAAVNPGNSGGALVNTNGELVGINTAIITRSGRYEGYSFAIPANLVRKVVKDLKDYGVVQRAILGIRIAKVTNRLAEDNDMQTPEGVVIDEVFRNSAADDAGLRQRDIIVGINGRQIRSIPELQENVARFRPGNTIKVDYIRSGELNTTNVILKNLNNEVSVATSTSLDDNALQDLGFELRDLSKYELQRLPVEGGAMVRSIYEGSIIERTNMDPGFIITGVNEIERGTGDNVRKLNQFEVNSVEDVVNALAKIRSGVVLLEGVYENYPGEWGYTFDLK